MTKKKVRKQDLDHAIAKEKSYKILLLFFYEFPPLQVCDYSAGVTNTLRQDMREQVGYYGEATAFKGTFTSLCKQLAILSLYGVRAKKMEVLHACTIHK